MKVAYLALLLILFGSCTQTQKTAPEKETVSHDSCQTELCNPVITTILERRSIRKYKPIPVEKDKLELIVKCGLNAPSGMNKQPWEVRVVDSQDYIDGLTEIFKKENPKMTEDPNFKNMFRNAPALIFVASPKDGSGQLDCGLLGENMMLAAWSLGLGSCCQGGPIAFMKSSEAAKPYVEKLQISDDYQLLYVIGIGYADESPEAKPRDMNKAMFIN